jgi:hypothetical protein
VGILRVEGDSLFGVDQGQKGAPSVPCWLFCPIAVDYGRFWAKRGDQDQDQDQVCLFCCQGQVWSPNSVPSQLQFVYKSWF